MSTKTGTTTTQTQEQDTSQQQFQSWQQQMLQEMLRSQQQRSRGRTMRLFDPAALDIYGGLQPKIAGTLGEFLGDPWQAGYFQQALGRTQEQIGQQGQTALAGALNLASMPGAGVYNLPAYLAAEAGRIQRSGQRAQGNALTDLLLKSSDLRQQALNMAAGYRPLELGQETEQEATSEAQDRGTSSSSGTSEGRETGTMHGSSRGTQTTRTGGLGTWLPSVLGLGLGALTGGLGLLPGLAGGLGGVLGGMGTMAGLPLGGVSNPFLGAPQTPNISPMKQWWWPVVNQGRPQPQYGGPL